MKSSVELILVGSLINISNKPNFSACSTWLFIKSKGNENTFTCDGLVIAIPLDVK